jgi:hypothetical protein
MVLVITPQRMKERLQVAIIMPNQKEVLRARTALEESDLMMEVAYLE